MMGRMKPTLAVLACLAAIAAPAAEAPAATREPAPAGIEALDQADLRSIDAWLLASGREGYLAADVADAAGIPRAAAEEVLEVSQRGFRSGDVLHVAQRSSDERRGFLLFMVQRPAGEVVFFVSTVREGLRKAFVSIPGGPAVVALAGDEARASFQRELAYWQARAAGG